MISKKMMIAIATLVLFVGSIVSSQEYQVVKVWPEAPQGWHFFNLNGVAIVVTTKSRNSTPKVD
jgi:hypothetical protein